jgi:DNA-binding response OmpR family regulator
VARVLLSESDPDVRRLLVLLLERLGHEAFPLVQPTEPPPGDLMLLEPAWPAGLAHARAARAQQPELPIVCVSILPEEASFLELGPLEYLMKPFALTELREAVDRTLAARAEAAAAA